MYLKGCSMWDWRRRGASRRCRSYSNLDSHASMKAVIISLALACIVLPGCTRNYVERKIADASAAQSLIRWGPSALLKAHMKDGQVCVFSSWEFHDSARAVSGKGRFYDINRDSIGSGLFTLQYDSIALFESNVVSSRAGAASGLIFLSGVSVVASVYCLSNPKACFGSCPTFYAWDGHAISLQAEGFSSSIAPALERTDVDQMFTAVPRGRGFQVQVKNEALETQVIRAANILAVPRPRGGRVFSTDGGSFFEAELLNLPLVARAATGDVSQALRTFDGREYFSSADSTDLAAREEVEIEFQNAPPGRLGLVISCRQTLMTTYLLYQGLAYMGRSAGHWLAELVRRGEKAREMAGGAGRLLGQIEVLAAQGGAGWSVEGSTGETGPIAEQVSVVPLSGELSRDGVLHLRLRMTRGFWRIDHVGLARLGPRAVPLRLEPTSIVPMGTGEPFRDTSWELEKRPLVLLPGDAYTLNYRLPEDPGRYELFMESRGYYLEWIRSEWLAEENPAMVAQMFSDPATFLRTMAPAFKRAEPTMEATFWSSRYERIP